MVRLARGTHTHNLRTQTHACHCTLNCSCASDVLTAVSEEFRAVLAQLTVDPVLEALHGRVLTDLLATACRFHSHPPPWTAKSIGMLQVDELGLTMSQCLDPCCEDQGRAAARAHAMLQQQSPKRLTLIPLLGQ
eukprot:3117102-Amphidinium_carterae.1